DTGGGCLAMSFGYHSGERYDVSVAVDVHRLQPARREAPEGTLVVADGFSCRGQIGQLAGREALHVAELVQRALRESGRTGPESLAMANGSGSRAGVAAAVAGAGAATALVALAARHRR